MDQTRVDDDMAFDKNYLGKPTIDQKIKGMSAGQLEAFSVQMSKIKHTEMSKYHAYWCFFLLIMISVVNTF